MKKIILIAFCLIPITGLGQTNAGSWLVNGSVSFSFNDVSEEVNNDSRDIGGLTTYSINPSAGYFIIDGIAVGLGMDYYKYSYKDNDNDRFINRSFSLTPFIRYYSQLGPFFHGQISIGEGSEFEKPENQNREEIFEYSVFGLGLGVGYPYFVNDHVAIEPVILFRANNETYNEPFTNDEITEKRRGIFVQIGLAYYIF